MFGLCLFGLCLFGLCCNRTSVRYPLEIRRPQALAAIHENGWMIGRHPFKVLRIVFLLTPPPGEREPGMGARNDHAVNSSRRSLFGCCRAQKKSRRESPAERRSPGCGPHGSSPRDVYRSRPPGIFGEPSTNHPHPRVMIGRPPRRWFAS